MALKYISKLFQNRLFQNCLLAWLAASVLMASEHHGVVKFGGLPLPGATVTATQDDKKLEAITDQNGIYSFPELKDGIWTIKVEMLCFKPEVKEVAVAPDAPSPVWDMQLLPVDQIKPVAETPAAPPAAGAVSTTATAGAAPGTAAAAGAAASGTSAAAGNAGATPSINAAVAAANKGGNGKGKSKKGKKNAQAAPTNTPSGFQRTELNASAGAASLPGENAASAAPNEFAQSSSDALLVNGSSSNGIESRAIGNARRGPGSMYRGALFSTLDNSVLDATPFSVNGADTPKAYYNNMTFGGTLGGPLYIPHLTHWSPNSGNFFLNLQIRRNRNTSSTPGLMPTEAQRSGDFSQLPVTVTDPTTGQPFPGNIIPQNRISPQAATLLNLYPMPNFLQSSLLNYQVPIDSTNNMEVLQTRINRTINRYNFINGVFNYQGTDGKNPNLFGFVDTSNSSAMNANLAWRHIFNREWTGLLSYNFSRYTVTSTPYFANKENIAGQAGITGDNQDPINWGPPALNFASGISGLSDGEESVQRRQTSILSPTVYWIHRPHNISFGMDYRRIDSSPLYQQDPRGTFTFTGAASGYDFADFLLGIPDASSIAFGNADKYFHTTWLDAYFNDDWRVSSGLTINGGLRWEYQSPITEQYGRLVNLDVAPGFTSVAPVLGTNPIGSITGQHYPNALLHSDTGGFEPGLGIAWHPFFGSSMLVRAGYKVSFNTSVYSSIVQEMAQQYPFSKTLSLQNTTANPLTLANGFNAIPGVLPNTFGVDPDFRIGYAQNWQVSVQQDLMEGIVLTATYLGTKGTRATQEFEPNTYPIGAQNPCPTCPAGYYYETSNGNSTREAGQLQIRRRFHAGFQASITYTYAKAIDDAALGGAGGAYGSGGTSAVIAQNWLDLSAERGLSNFDQRHEATVTAQYSPGTGLHGGALLSGWRGAIFKGWTFVTTLTLGTGLPLTPSDLVAVPPTGFTCCIRPEYTGVSVYSAPAGRWLNPAAYIAPLPGQWGDAGRDSITGPAQFSLSGSMGRTFTDHLDVRFDATNLLNNVTFPSWNTTLGNAQFGLPLSANGMRKLQATVRWRF
ncbi:MAG TPA: carboxypeptidase regulatory-like domain-containing protein [Bryobacteraceae bacterium]|nr:carboxypeptidase regulatory-like domain-containing protein [Bryobacteraceae bacterium]